MKLFPCIRSRLAILKSSCCIFHTRTNVALTRQQIVPGIAVQPPDGFIIEEYMAKYEGARIFGVVLMFLRRWNIVYLKSKIMRIDF